MIASSRFSKAWRETGRLMHYLRPRVDHFGLQRAFKIDP